MAQEFIRKVVLITGAAAGQGRAAAIMFARAGASLALCDIDDEGLKETAALVVDAADVDVLVQRCDMSSIPDVEGFVDMVTEHFGVIDVIYNNAGVMSRASIEETTEAEWDRVNDINVKGPYFLVRRALPALRRSESGVVLNVSSTSGMAPPREGNTAYCASKGAVISLTRAQAKDLAPDGIRVNCLLPGPIDTAMPAGAFAHLPEEKKAEAKAAAVSRAMIRRFADPAEVAAVALFLAGPGSSFMTGAVIPVDGGWTAS